MWGRMKLPILIMVQTAITSRSLHRRTERSVFLILAIRTNEFIAKNSRSKAFRSQREQEQRCFSRRVTGTGFVGEADQRPFGGQRLQGDYDAVDRLPFDCCRVQKGAVVFITLVRHVSDYWSCELSNWVQKGRRGDHIRPRDF